MAPTIPPVIAAALDLRELSGVRLGDEGPGVVDVVDRVDVKVVVVGVTTKPGLLERYETTCNRSIE
jgi:hypothetical protein